MCRNLFVRHYYLSCLCLYSLSLCKNKYVSWSTTPIYSVFEAIPKRRFLHRKKMRTSNLRYHPQQQKEVSTLAEGKIFVSLSPPVSMHTILIQASTFSTVWVKRGFYIGKTGEFQRNVPFPRPFTQSGCWVVPWYAKERFLHRKNQLS